MKDETRQITGSLFYICNLFWWLVSTYFKPFTSAFVLVLFNFFHHVILFLGVKYAHFRIRLH